MSRPKHPNKELEAVLREAEDMSWRVEKRARGYFKMKCPCDEKHMKTVKISPSNPYYEQQLRGQLSRATCWDDSEGSEQDARSN